MVLRGVKDRKKSISRNRVGRSIIVNVKATWLNDISLFGVSAAK